MAATYWTDSSPIVQVDSKLVWAHMIGVEGEDLEDEEDSKLVWAHVIGEEEEDFVMEDDFIPSRYFG